MILGRFGRPRLFIHTHGRRVRSISDTCIRLKYCNRSQFLARYSSVHKICSSKKGDTCVRRWLRQSRHQKLRFREKIGICMKKKKRPELLHYEVILHCDSTRIHQQSQSCQMNMSSQCSNIVTILVVLFHLTSGYFSRCR